MALSSLIRFSSISVTSTAASAIAYLLHYTSVNSSTTAPSGVFKPTSSGFKKKDEQRKFSLCPSLHPLILQEVHLNHCTHQFYFYIFCRDRKSRLTALLPLAGSPNRCLYSLILAASATESNSFSQIQFGALPFTTRSMQSFQSSHRTESTSDF